MKGIHYLESFPTIGQCIDYLISIGCPMGVSNETLLRANSSLSHKNTLVLHDPYNILSSTQAEVMGSFDQNGDLI